MFTLPIDCAHCWVSNNGQRSSCRVRIWVSRELGSLVCMMTELGDNPGETITTGMESLIESLVDLYLGRLDFESVYWVEHFVAYPVGKGWDQFHRVQYSPENNPVFTSISLRFMSILVDSAPVHISLQGDKCGVGSKKRPGKPVSWTCFSENEYDEILKTERQRLPKLLAG